MSQPESKLSRAIMTALSNRGAFVWKNHGGATMMSGLPDIVGVYLGMFIGIETKMPDGDKPTAVQRRVHTKIREAGGHVLAPCTSVRQAVAWLATLDVTPPDPTAARSGHLGRSIDPVARATTIEVGRSRGQRAPGDSFDAWDYT